MVRRSGTGGRNRWPGGNVCGRDCVRINSILSGYQSVNRIENTNDKKNKIKRSNVNIKQK